MIKLYAIISSSISDLLILNMYSETKYKYFKIIIALIAHLIYLRTITWTKEDYIPFCTSANYSQHSRLNHFSMTSIKLLFMYFLLIVFVSAAWNNNIRYKPTYNPLLLNLMIPQPSMNCRKPVLTNWGRELFLHLFSPMLQISICYVNAP